MEEELDVILSEESVRYVTCPYCRTWMCNLSPTFCKHVKEWTEDYVSFKEIDRNKKK